LAGFPFYGELRFVKSGTASGCAALTAAGKAAQPDAKGRFLIVSGRASGALARRVSGGQRATPRA